MSLLSHSHFSAYSTPNISSTSSPLHAMGLELFLLMTGPSALSQSDYDKEQRATTSLQWAATRGTSVGGGVVTASGDNP